MKMRVLIIDDEPLARTCVADYVQRLPFFDLLGSCSHPAAWTEPISNKTVDLLFLDIQMPVINGIDFLRKGSELPMVVLTTAYPSFALEGFQLAVLDYLLKPITFTRFEQAAGRALEQWEMKMVARQQDYFFVRVNAVYEKIFYHQIRYIEANQNYVSIYTDTDRFMTLITMQRIEQQLPPAQFVRVHKSYIVPVSRIVSLESGEVVLHGVSVPLGRSYKDDVFAKVVHRRMLK